MSNLIYLASPYSIGEGTRKDRFTIVCKKAAELMNKGHAIFCPIAHSHAIEEEGMSTIQDGHFWLQQDFAVLSKCSELWVYKMPMWEQSKGVFAEIAFAHYNNIPVKYIEYENQS